MHPYTLLAKLSRQVIGENELNTFKRFALNQETQKGLTRERDIVDESLQKIFSKEALEILYDCKITSLGELWKYRQLLGFLTGYKPKKEKTQEKKETKQPISPLELFCAIDFGYQNPENIALIKEYVLRNPEEARPYLRRCWTNATKNGNGTLTEFLKREYSQLMKK
ncbi:hypothetical protein HY486_02725 [Candidatus Woesearchaeota archaeon]|nr:hypothetical protein [Candidatus Woesearchaeota archaeon]